MFGVFGVCCLLVAVCGCLLVGVLCVDCCLSCGSLIDVRRYLLFVVIC